MPAPYNNNRRYLQDQLDEYRAYAGGNFQYEFIDPKSSEEAEQEAQRYGIPPVQVQVLKEDKFQVDNAYMGLVFLHGDKQERIPVIRSTSNLEYEISSAIKKLTSKELKKVGFLAGQGEPELEQFKRLQEILARQYQVTKVDMTGGRAIPADVAVLVIAAPDRKFASWEKYLIDQYLMKGGRAAFFLNKVGITLQGQMGRPLDLGLDDMLASYGVRVSADLVRDRSCAYVTVSQQAGFMVIQNQIPFYYLPRASNFEESNPLVRGLNSVVLYFASSIDTALARSKGLNANVLLRSSGESGRQENVFMVDPTAPVTAGDVRRERHPAGRHRGGFVRQFVRLGAGAPGLDGDHPDRHRRKGADEPHAVEDRGRWRRRFHAGPVFGGEPRQFPPRGEPRGLAGR